MTDRQQRIEEDADEGEVLELTEEVIEEGGEDDEAPGKIVVQIGDDEPEEVEEAPDWVKDLRRTNREQAKRIKELEQAKEPADKPKLGTKPTMESCDYDAAELERQLDAWYLQKAKVDAAETEAQAQQRRAEERWQAKMAKLEADKAALGAEDIGEAEETVREIFDVVRQGLIVSASKNAAQVFYALAKNPTKARELNAIEDHAEFIAEVARMETQLKIGKRSVPAPEAKVTLKSRPGSVTDNTLEKLRAEAEKTGDISKVMAYKRQMRAKERA